MAHRFSLLTVLSTEVRLSMPNPGKRNVANRSNGEQAAHVKQARVAGAIAAQQMPPPPPPARRRRRHHRQCRRQCCRRRHIRGTSPAGRVWRGGPAAAAGCGWRCACAKLTAAAVLPARVRRGRAVRQSLRRRGRTISCADAPPPQQSPPPPTTSDELRLRRRPWNSNRAPATMTHQSPLCLAVSSPTRSLWSE